MKKGLFGVQKKVPRRIHLHPVGSVFFPRKIDYREANQAAASVADQPYYLFQSRMRVGQMLERMVQHDEVENRLKSLETAFVYRDPFRVTNIACNERVCSGEVPEAEMVQRSKQLAGTAAKIENPGIEAKAERVIAQRERKMVRHPRFCLENCLADQAFSLQQLSPGKPCRRSPAKGFSDLHLRIERKIIVGVIQRHIAELADLDSAARRAFEVFEFFAGAVHHLAAGQRSNAFPVLANSANKGHTSKSSTKPGSA